MANTKTYVLTGGPGSGKTSLLNCLEFYHNEFTIREAAEDYIKLQQALGIGDPWNNPNFQKEILDLQLKRKKNIPQGIDRIFVDRDVIDGLAYLTPGRLYNHILSEAKKQTLEKVFLIENLGQTDTNIVRRENQEEAIMLENKLSGLYTSMGYDIIRIPSAPIKERTEMIMGHI